MDSDKQLEQKPREYQELAKEDKNIDVAALMASALENNGRNLLAPGLRRWGYLVSVAVPPFGLIFAAIFYFGSKDDGKRAAYICMALTAISVLLGYFIIKIMFSSAGVSTEQFKQLPSEYKQLLQ